MDDPACMYTGEGFGNLDTNPQTGIEPKRAASLKAGGKRLGLGPALEDQSAPSFTGLYSKRLDNRKLPNSTEYFMLPTQARLALGAMDVHPGKLDQYRQPVGSASCSIGRAQAIPTRLIK